jgi:hypothetical protein
MRRLFGCWAKTTSKFPALAALSLGQVPEQNNHLSVYVLPDGCSVKKNEL